MSAAAPLTTLFYRHRARCEMGAQALDHIRALERLLEELGYDSPKDKVRNLVIEVGAIVTGDMLVDQTELRDIAIRDGRLGF